jgi:hypothetical protein
VTGRYYCRLLPICLFFFVLLSQFSLAQDVPKCESQAVRYKPFDPKFAKQIRVAVLESSYQEPADSEKQPAPQRTMWFVKTDPDFTKPGPWNTSIVISARPKGKAFRLTIVDHSNTSPNAEWLNEKLLFVQVWWGQVVSTDMVFDTEKGQFVYKEMANYSEINEPCQ